MITTLENNSTANLYSNHTLEGNRSTGCVAVLCRKRETQTLKTRSLIWQMGDVNMAETFIYPLQNHSLSEIHLTKFFFFACIRLYKDAHHF